MNKLQLKLAELRGVAKGFGLALKFFQGLEKFNVVTESFGNITSMKEEVKKLNDDIEKEFLEAHLQRAQATFRSWPAWKQEAALQWNEKIRRDAENMRYDD